MKDKHHSALNYSPGRAKPPLTMTVREAKGSKAEQKRIAEIARLGKLFDEANDPRLKPSTRINKLYRVRNGYVEAGFTEYLAPKVTALILSIKKGEDDSPPLLF